MYHACKLSISACKLIASSVDFMIFTTLTQKLISELMTVVGRSLIKTFKGKVYIDGWSSGGTSEGAWNRVDSKLRCL